MSTRKGSCHMWSFLFPVSESADRGQGQRRNGWFVGEGLADLDNILWLCMHS